MKPVLYLFILICGVLVCSNTAFAQCSICTKTASQLGEGPAKSLNAAIIYLMIMPLSIIGVIAYFWFKRNKAN